MSRRPGSVRASSVSPPAIGLKVVLLDGDGRVRRTHQLFLNGEQVERGDYPLGTAPVSCTAPDTLFVLTAVAGG